MNSENLQDCLKYTLEELVRLGYLTSSYDNTGVERFSITEIGKLELMYRVKDKEQ